MTALFFVLGWLSRSLWDRYQRWEREGRNVEPVSGVDLPWPPRAGTFTVESVPRRTVRFRDPESLRKEGRL